MKNQRGIEELLSDMLIKQDEQTSVLKTHSDILKDHTSILKEVVQGQNRLETKFDGLFSYLRDNVTERMNSLEQRIKRIEDAKNGN